MEAPKVRQVPIPYKFEARDYQIPFLRAMNDVGFKRAVIVWNRRTGKDLTVVAGVVVPKMLERVGTYFYIFPTYNQGRKALWDSRDKEGIALLDRFPPEAIKSKNESEMRIEFTNGSAFQIIGCDNIDNIVGTNPVGVVFSEYPIGKAQAWDFIRPILAENGGWAVFDFTPRGMNHGWTILQQAKASENWFYQVLTIDDTKVLSQAELEEEKRQMPEDLFYQEYYCKFVDGAGTFFRNIDQCLYDDKYEENPDKRFNIQQGKTFRLGVDLAKFQDFTVITPIDLTTFKVGPQESFNRIDYTLQKTKIESQHFKYNKAEITIDSTGVGEPIYDDLNNAKIPVRPYHFTEISRKNLLTNLQVLMEQGIIKIPNEPELIAQLRSFQYELGENGKVKIVVPEGVHDDRVFSLALACWELPTRPLPFRRAEERALVKEFDSHKIKEKEKYFSGSQYLRRRP